MLLVKKIMLPFVDRFPTDNELYGLLTTRLGGGEENYRGVTSKLEHKIIKCICTTIVHNRNYNSYRNKIMAYLQVVVEHDKVTLVGRLLNY